MKNYVSTIFVIVLSQVFLVAILSSQAVADDSPDLRAAHEIDRYLTCCEKGVERLWKARMEFAMIGSNQHREKLQLAKKQLIESSRNQFTDVLALTSKRSELRDALIEYHELFVEYISAVGTTAQMQPREYYRVKEGLEMKLGAKREIVRIHISTN